MLDFIPILISTAALTVSATTAWLTLFRRGTVKMTQPTIIFFGPDGINGPPKVFLRTILYSTSKKGHIIESMYLKLRRAESVQTFNVWVYGDAALARGSGLYVGEQGITCNHHFLLPRDGTIYPFLSGHYILEVYISPINTKSPHLISKTNLTLLPEQAQALAKNSTGIFFDWGPDSGLYHAHIDTDPKKRLAKYITLPQE